LLSPHDSPGPLFFVVPLCKELRVSGVIIAVDDDHLHPHLPRLRLLLLELLGLRLLELRLRLRLLDEEGLLLLDEELLDELLLLLPRLRLRLRLELYVRA
jgi:hypothetical protein